MRAGQSGRLLWQGCWGGWVQRLGAFVGADTIPTGFMHLHAYDFFNTHAYFAWFTRERHAGSPTLRSVNPPLSRD